MVDEILNQTIRKSDTPVDALDGVREKVLELWHMVAADMRWETHASFAVMLTRILLNTSPAEANRYEAVVLWVLKGDPPAFGASVSVDDDAGSDSPAAGADDADADARFPGRHRTHFPIPVSQPTCIPVAGPVYRVMCETFRAQTSIGFRIDISKYRTHFQPCSQACWACSPMAIQQLSEDPFCRALSYR